MLTINEIEKKASELKELQAMADELNAEIESLKDELKAEMLDRDTDELVAGKHIIRFKEFLSNRFDTTAFKKVMPEVYKAYTKQTTSRRFTVS